MTVKYRVHDCYIQVNFAENIRQLKFLVVYIYRAVEKNIKHTETAVINIVSFRIFINLTFRMLFKHTIFKSDLK